MLSHRFPFSQFERWASGVVGLLAPIGFLVGMETIPLNAIIRGFVSVGIASVVAGLALGTAVVLQAEEADRKYPLP